MTEQKEMVEVKIKEVGMKHSKRIMGSSINRHLRNN